MQDKTNILKKFELLREKYSELMIKNSENEK
jgi:hypothetical protein